MKFKIGDKVRLLPSAIEMSIPDDEVGKTGVIVSWFSPTDMTVSMDKPRKSNGLEYNWCVATFCIESVKGVGQLLFDFMTQSMEEVKL